MRANSGFPLTDVVILILSCWAE